MIDFLIVLIYVLLAVTIAATIVALVREHKARHGEQRTQNGVPALLISRCTGIGLCLLLIITFIVASSAPMPISGGGSFGQWIWLKVADMFIYSAAVLLAAAFGAMLFGFKRLRRAGGRK